MITGTITNLRPQIRLYVKGVGVNGVFEFTIDTGYQGTLTLAEADCLALKLPWVKKATFQLADGKPIKRNVYRLTIVWDGRERDVEVLALADEPLLGAVLLDGYKLCLDFGNNTLTIEASTTEDGADR